MEVGPVHKLVGRDMVKQGKVEVPEQLMEVAWVENRRSEEGRFQQLGQGAKAAVSGREWVLKCLGFSFSWILGGLTNTRKLK